MIDEEVNIPVPYNPARDRVHTALNAMEDARWERETAKVVLAKAIDKMENAKQAYVEAVLDLHKVEITNRGFKHAPQIDGLLPRDEDQDNCTTLPEVD